MKLQPAKGSDVNLQLLARYTRTVSLCPELFLIFRNLDVSARITMPFSENKIKKRSQFTCSLTERKKRLDGAITKVAETKLCK